MDKCTSIASEDNGPAEKISLQEQQRIVVSALSHLPQDYRQVLVLFYREEKSVKAVAEQLDISEDAVKTRLSRGREMLREHIEATIEKTLASTKPGKAFTPAVMAGIAGIAVGSSSAALTGSGTVTAYTGVSAIMAGLTAKILTAAAVVVIGAAAVVTYTQFTKPNPAPDSSTTAAIVQQQEQEPDMPPKVITENPQAAGLAADATEAMAVSTQNSASEIIADANQANTKTGISGIVKDKSTSKPIKGAEIIYGPYNSRRSVFSDANGHFEALDIPPGPRQQLRVIAKTYATRTFTLDIEANKVYQDFKVELGPGSKVAGTVTDPNGKPVEGATVETFHFTNHPVITGKDGTFEIDGLDPAFGQYQLQATHPNYPAANVTFMPLAAGQTAFVDFAFEHGINVYGQVTNARGEPIAGVSVGNTTSRAMWNCISGKTDKDGKYQLNNVPAGDLVLWAVVNKYVPYVERFTLSSSDYAKLINIQLADASPFSGKIVDRAGTPIAGAQVFIFEYKGVTNLIEHSDYVTSGADGKFCISNGPSQGMVKLEAYSESIGIAMADFDANSQKEHVITVDRVGRICGKVLNDKTGEPVDKFNVKMVSTAKGGTQGIYDATWSREGHSFDSPHGFFDTGIEPLPVGAQYAVMVTADGFDPLTIDPVTVQQITEEPNRTEFRLKGATVLAGRVVDGNGVPIAGATVRWFSETEKLRQSEHWDPADMTTTNAKGEFALSGIGTGKIVVNIKAKNFAPYFGLIAELPKNSENNIEIILSHGAELYGRIIGPQGQGFAQARIIFDSSNEQAHKIFGSSHFNFSETIADSNGYYEISELPSGKCQVTVMTPLTMGNQFFANKKISLKAGESTELNFGDEPGFTVTGVVRIGPKLLGMANVQIRFPDQTMKCGQTDSKGQFVITGVPKGIYPVNANYSSVLGPTTFQRNAGQQLSDYRQVNIDSNTSIDIDFGDGSVSGNIPGRFLEYGELQISARRFAENPVKREGIQQNWEYGGQGKIDSKGNFEFQNLRPGRYYLTLNASNETLAISDLFELAESQHLENITFITGSGKLLIHITDAETGQDISQAGFTIKNDMDASFYSKKLVPKGKSYGMATDERGWAEYADLPKGRYIVWGQLAGYLIT